MYVCKEHLKYTWDELMVMPVYVRRYFIQKYREDMEERKEKMDEMQKNRSSGGKGSRSKTISGAALKTQMRNNQIPNQ